MTTEGTTIPTADARLLGLAHYAARGALEHVLAAHELTFEHNVALRTVITADRQLSPDELAGVLQGSLKLDPAATRSVLDELIDRKLLAADGDRLVPSNLGHAVYQAAAAATAAVASRIWRTSIRTISPPPVAFWTWSDPGRTRS